MTYIVKYELTLAGISDLQSASHGRAEAESDYRGGKWARKGIPVIYLLG